MMTWEWLKRIVNHQGDGTKPPRDFALFTVGINTAYRASDILSWKVGDVRGLELATRPNAHDEEFLFAGPDPMKAITVGWFGRLVKRWCHDAQLRHGNWGAHTLRKTWGYMQRTEFKTPIEVQAAYGHTTSHQTLTLMILLFYWAMNKS